MISESWEISRFILENLLLHNNIYYRLKHVLSSKLFLNQEMRIVIAMKSRNYFFKLFRSLFTRCKLCIYHSTYDFILLTQFIIILSENSYKTCCIFLFRNFLFKKYSVNSSIAMHCNVLQSVANNCNNCKYWYYNCAFILHDIYYYVNLKDSDFFFFQDPQGNLSFLKIVDLRRFLWCIYTSALNVFSK